MNSQQQQQRNEFELFGASGDEIIEAGRKFETWAIEELNLSSGQADAAVEDEAVMYYNDYATYLMEEQEMDDQELTNEMYLICAFSLTDYMKYEKLSIFILLRNLAKAIADYKSVLTMKFPDEIISIVVKNGPEYIAMYSYLRSFFAKIEEKYPDCTVYSVSAKLPSHAAIISNLKTINMYHGLMEKINLSTFPEYDSVYVYSYDERKTRNKLIVPQIRVENNKRILGIDAPQ